MLICHFFYLWLGERVNPEIELMESSGSEHVDWICICVTSILEPRHDHQEFREAGAVNPLILFGFLYGS